MTKTLKTTVALLTLMAGILGIPIAARADLIVPPTSIPLEQTLAPWLSVALVVGAGIGFVLIAVIALLLIRSRKKQQAPKTNAKPK